MSEKAKTEEKTAKTPAVETADNKEVKAAETAAKTPEAKSAKTSKSKASASTKKKVKILCHNAAGKYGLSYNYGDVAKLDAKQVDELIAAKDGEEA